MKNSIIIDGKEVLIPDSLINEIKEKLKSNVVSIEQQKEQFFLNNLNGCTIMKEENSHYINFIKNSKIIMQQDITNKYFYFDYDEIWRVFSDTFHLDYSQTQSFMKGMLEKHLNLKEYTTIYWRTLKSLVLEKHLNLKEYTTSKLLSYRI